MTRPPPSDTGELPAAPSAVPSAAADTPEPRGVSPTRLALRRFLHHRLAVLGALLVVAMTLAAFCGPLLLHHDPSLIRPWLHNLPPGARVPDALSLNRLSTLPDPPTTVPASWIPEGGTGATHVSVAYSRSESYRLVLRRGRIATMMRHSDTAYLDTLDLTGDYASLQTVPEGDGQVRDLQPFAVAVGDLPPPLLIAGERVLVVRATEHESVHQVILHWQDGAIQSIRYADGGAADEAHPDLLEIDGSKILAVSRDGELVELYFLLGTDASGRDMLTRVLAGGRISLLVGIVATLVSLVIGVLYGAVSAYFGGKVDRLMMGTVDVLYAIPFMFVVIILLAIFSRSIVMLFIALGAVQWLTMARIVRGQVLSLKEQEFIAAARLSGCGPFTIITRHLIPHTVGPVVVYTSLTVPAVILEESFLSFLGLSVKWGETDLSSWGLLVNDGIEALGDGGQRWWMLLVPALALAATLFGLNAIGDGLRDAFDPKHAKV